MPDLAPLHRRLRRALVLATLLPACTATTSDDAKSPDKADADKDGKKDPNVDPPPEPPTTAVVIDTNEPPPELPEPTTAVPPEPDFNFPSCPSGEWCGPKKLIEPLRRTDLNTPIDDVEGCPGAIQGNNSIDQSKFEKYPGLPLDGSMLANVDGPATKAKREAGEKDMCCYDWMTLCPGGRPLLVEGEAVVASLRPGSDWSADLPATIEPPEHLRQRIADEWLRDALTEHASIASFRRARAELRAIGAPAALLEACERAANDEIEHARLCFALAERFGDRSLAPAELLEPAPRGGGPIAVALDTFVEGCVGETIAAACARRAAELAVDPVVRAVLERIADDEAEHAALAWATIAWLVEREGPEIATALRERAELLRDVDVEAGASASELHAHGRLDARELACMRRQAWDELIDPLLAEFGAPAQLAA